MAVLKLGNCKRQNEMEWCYEMMDWNDFFEFSDVSQSIHKDSFWQSVM